MYLIQVKKSFINSHFQQHIPDEGESIHIIFPAQIGSAQKG